MIGKKVLIRSDRSGLHFGTLVSEDHTLAGIVCTLRDSRRIHYWEKACSCSQIALEGVEPKASRVAMVLPEIKVAGCIEIIPLSKSAIENLENQNIWKS